MYVAERKEEYLASGPQMIKNDEPSLAAIVPAFNEAKRIRQVISVLQNSNLLSQIIIVDDGSTDGTGDILESHALSDKRIQVIRHSANQGKGESLRSGLLACEQAHTVLMLDADLSGLLPTHISALAEPVMTDQSDMTLGLFVRGKWHTDLAHRLTPWLTGQRCFRANLLSQLNWEAAQGYGLETAITLTARNLKWRIKHIYLEGVTHPPSEFHHGLRKGILNRGKMYGQIARTWWTFIRKKNDIESH
jgi:polyisoprenyl-phosphate glycosyltransferase